MKKQFYTHSYYTNRNPYAITFVSNKPDSYRKFEDRLKKFHLKVDTYRFGRGVHRNRNCDRLDFWVVPEKFDAGHPHYHGFLSMPCTGRGFVFGTPIERKLQILECIWSKVSPGGSIDLQAIYNAEGWERYSSKENSLATSDRSIWSLSNFHNFSR